MTIIWGSTFVLAKVALVSASPLVYMFLRFSIATVLFLVIFFRNLTNLTKDVIYKGFILGILLFLGFVLQTVGLQYTTASKSAFITGLTVIFTPFLQTVIQNKIPKVGNIIGAVLATYGLYMLTSPTGFNFNFGDILTLLSAVAFSVYIIYIDIYGKMHNPIQLTFMQFITNAMICLLAIPLIENPYIKISTSFIFVILYLAIMPTVIALYILTKYQRYTTPTRSVIIYTLEPPIAALFAYFILKELLETTAIIGATLILTGVLTSELSEYFTNIIRKILFKLGQ